MVAEKRTEPSDGAQEGGGTKAWAGTPTAKSDSNSDSTLELEKEKEEARQGLAMLLIVCDE